MAKRPSLGALKRSREAAAAAEKVAAAEAPAAATTEGGGGVEAVAATTTTAAPSTGASDAGATGAAPPVAASTVDRDSLTEAWGDTVLRGLPARAKALYSAGRFVSVDDDGGAHFALPNARTVTVASK